MIDNNLVSFVIDNHFEYSNDEFYFSPSEKYPEYPFEELSSGKNTVYEKVRRSFFQLGLDKEHYGTKEWNPFGEFIKPGQQVLLKPNWVMHVNPRKDSLGMQCLVTQPSVIRAVLDFVIIALKGTGKIIVGDAPMYQCYFEELQKNLSYDKLWNYYYNKNISLEIKDFRNFIIDRSNKDDIIKKVSKDDGILVDLGDKACLDEFDEKQINKFKIFGYPSSLMHEGHSKGKHKFLIHQDVLNADVIINLPKPKSHRKAGMTACAKNFIGINCRKEYLPHHRDGAISSGGDEYPSKNIFKAIHAKIHELNSRFIKPNKVFRLIDKVTRGLELVFSINKKYDGCWYGNDTLWRTIADLNRIVQYADKQGIIKESKQRTIFNVCDMIISGEEEGPLRPTPKKVGAIVSGFEIAYLDCFIATLMGFDINKIKYIPYLLEKNNLDRNALKIALQDKTINFDNFDLNLNFKPTSGWQGHIEKQ